MRLYTRIYFGECLLIAEGPAKLPAKENIPVFHVHHVLVARLSKVNKLVVT